MKVNNDKRSSGGRSTGKHDGVFVVCVCHTQIVFPYVHSCVVHAWCMCVRYARHSGQCTIVQAWISMHHSFESLLTVIKTNNVHAYA